MFILLALYNTNTLHGPTPRHRDVAPNSMSSLASLAPVQTIAR